MTLTFDKKYFLLFLILFTVELIIAIYVRDQFVRPYFGDFVVVILIYCFLKSFFKTSDFKTGVLVFVFACIMETLQAFDLVRHTGMTNSRIASIVFGTYFDWADILLYFLGISTVLFIEFLRKKNFNN